MSIRFLLRRLLLALVLVVPAAGHAQLFRAYLSVSGNDANACTLPAPCRLLPRAIAAVADGGEVWMLDSANYNTTTVDINKSVTVLAVPGVVGSLVGSANAVVNVNTPGVKVILRNLVFQPLPGAASGLVGVVATNGSTLTIDASQFRNLPGGAISISAMMKVRIIDCIVQGTGTHGIWVAGGANATIVETRVLDSGSSGVIVIGSTQGTSALVVRSTISGNQTGAHAFTIGATDKATLTIQGSVVERNVGGLQADSTAGGPTLVSAFGNLVSGNDSAAIRASGAGARIVAGDNAVTGNGIGLQGDAGGVAESFGDNRMRDNATATSGTIVPSLAKG